MDQQIQAEEERNMAVRVETDVVERDQLARWGFSTEEIVALFWLKRWYQTGGSDRMKLLHHWEFLKWLVKAGRLEM
ncbi:MAG: hypothetical protein ACJ797_23475 [Ktedonobacteraceae bacterium]